MLQKQPAFSFSRKVQAAFSIDLIKKYDKDNHYEKTLLRRPSRLGDGIPSVLFVVRAIWRIFGVAVGLRLHGHARHLGLSVARARNGVGLCGRHRRGIPAHGSGHLDTAAAHPRQIFDVAGGLMAGGAAHGVPALGSPDRATGHGIFLAGRIRHVAVGLGQPQHA